MTSRPCAVLLASACLFTACGGDDSPQGMDPNSGMDGSVRWAVAKVCHQLGRSNAAITLTLEFGNPVVARISALTNTCSPPAGLPCTAIPVGRVPVRLLEGDRELARAEFILQHGGEYGFEPFVNSIGRFGIDGTPLMTGRCMLDFLPPPDGGWPDVGPASDAGDGPRADGPTVDAGARPDATPDAAVDAPPPPDAAVDAPPPPDAAVDSPPVTDTADDTASVDTAADVAAGAVDAVVGGDGAND